MPKMLFFSKIAKHLSSFMQDKWWWNALSPALSSIQPQHFRVCALSSAKLDNMALTGLTVYCGLDAPSCTCMDIFSCQTIVKMDSKFSSSAL
jgi:hypothetical protein